LLSSVQGLKKFLEKEGGKEISLNTIYPIQFRSTNQKNLTLHLMKLL
jgi:hypothetical protein